MVPKGGGGGGAYKYIYKEILHVINNIKFLFLISQVNFAKYISARDIYGDTE